MTEEEHERSRQEIWGSVQGVILDGSVTRERDGLSATLISEDGTTVRIKGYGDRFADMIARAAERGGPVIFQGHAHGSAQDGTAHLAVRLEGPLELTGAVSMIRRRLDEGRPSIGFWLMREMDLPGGATHQVGTGVNVYGAQAAALSGLREGDRVRLEAVHGENGLVAVSPVMVLAKRDPDEPTL